MNLGRTAAWAAWCVSLVMSLESSARAEEAFEVGPFQPRHVWPVSATDTPDVALRGTFGPRLIGSEGFRYDFHRGIDIKTPSGSPVHAIADGEVRLAGQAEGYRTPVVQIRHFKPRQESCTGGGCYYSYYTSLSEAKVKEGDQVKQGDVVGLSGWSKNNFEHLDFEIRDGGYSQRNCVHPLAVLPYDNRTAPEVEVSRVMLGAASTTVEVNVKVASREADFNRLEVRLFSGDEQIDEKVYDIAEWNRLYSPKGKDADPLEEPKLHGVDVKPLARKQSDPFYEWTFTFDELKAVAKTPRPKVTAKAIDARGKSSEATR